MMIAVGIAIRAVANARWSVAGTRLDRDRQRRHTLPERVAEIAPHPSRCRPEELDVERLIETVLRTSRQVLLVGGLRRQHHLGRIADPVPQQEDEQQQADDDEHRMPQPLDQVGGDGYPPRRYAPALTRACQAGSDARCAIFRHWCSGPQQHHWTVAVPHEWPHYGRAGQRCQGNVYKVDSSATRNQDSHNRNTSQPSPAPIARPGADHASGRARGPDSEPPAPQPWRVVGAVQYARCVAAHALPWEGRRCACSCCSWSVGCW